MALFALKISSIKATLDLGKAPVDRRMNRPSLSACRSSGPKSSLGSVRGSAGTQSVVPQGYEDSLRIVSTVNFSGSGRAKKEKRFTKHGT